MGYYDLPVIERQALGLKINEQVSTSIDDSGLASIIEYAAAPDTYIRKLVYQSLGGLYRAEPGRREKIVTLIRALCSHHDEKARQTAVYAMGELGKDEPALAGELLKLALEDSHHKVRNGVAGALKQMGAKQPVQTFEFIKKHLEHPNPEVRRVMVHGLELRGRTRPEEVLPILEGMQGEHHKRVRPMLIHVLAQISYKEGCLERVLKALAGWRDQELISAVLAEILIIHDRYQKFSARTPEEARKMIERSFPGASAEAVKAWRRDR